MIDIVSEDIKRLIAFTGLKIINVDINEDDIVIHLRFRKKKFRLWIIHNKTILLDDKGNEIMVLKPKNKQDTLNISYTSFPQTTIGLYTITTPSSTGNFWFDGTSSNCGAQYAQYGSST